MMSERRKEARAIGYAKALHLPDLVPGYLRNISSAGCLVSLSRQVPAKVGQVVELRVMPVHDLSMAPFRVSVRIKWVRADAIWCSVGGELEKISSGSDRQSFEQLVRYFRG